MDTKYLYVGAYHGLEKWDLNTLQRLETINVGSVWVVSPYHGSLFLGGVFSNFGDIQERNISNLTQMIASYHGHTQGSGTFAFKDNFLFSGSSDKTVRKWNIQTKQLVQTLTYHTDLVLSVWVDLNYVFSGAFDFYWIQSDTQTGQIVRKMNTGGQVYSILTYPPYLITACNPGLYKYLIPELQNETLSAVGSSASVTTTQVISRVISSVITASPQSTDEILQISKPKTQTMEPPQSQTFGNLVFTTSQVASNQKVTTVPILSVVNQTLTLYYLIAIGAGALFLIFLCILFFYCYRKKKKQQKLNTTTSIDPFSTTQTTTSDMTTTSLSSTSKISGTNTTASTQITSTYMVTQNIYSIPGYLELNPYEIIIKNKIGKGSQAKVFLAEILNTNFQSQFHAKTVVYKTSENNFDQMNERQQNLFNQELAMIHYLRNHRGIVQLYGYLMKPASLILKYYPLGSMEFLIKREQHFKNLVTSRQFIIFFIYQISKTINELHEVGFVHCDIKSQNILIEMDQNRRLLPILTDFGISQVVSEQVLQVKAMTIENIKGFSLRYAAPEQISQMRQKVFKPMPPEMVKRRDIYALAGLLFGLMMKQEPWN